MTDTWRYQAFGETRARTGSSANPFGFVGELGYYQEAGLGLHYVRARWYDARTGRWVSEDPIEGGNLYGYVGNAAPVAADPSGMMTALEKKCHKLFSQFPTQVSMLEDHLSGYHCSKVRELLGHFLDGIGECAKVIGKLPPSDQALLQRGFAAYNRRCPDTKRKPFFFPLPWPVQLPRPATCPVPSDRTRWRNILIELERIGAAIAGGVMVGIATLMILDDGTIIGILDDGAAVSLGAAGAALLRTAACCAR